MARARGVVAVCTVIVYPLAIYMTWRFILEQRATGSRVCPRCAEKVKAAALVCRYCGQELEAEPERTEACSSTTSAMPSDVRQGKGLPLLPIIGILTTLVVVGFFAWIFLGGQVSRT